MKKQSLRLAPAAHPLAALSLALSLPCTALAQSAAGSLPPTVVTAARMEQPLTDVVADVTVIDREAIERSGASAVVDVLARVPGLAFLRNGGPGTNTDLYIRGAENRHTALFIDGIRVDSQSSGGGSWSGDHPRPGLGPLRLRRDRRRGGLHDQGSRRLHAPGQGRLCQRQGRL